MIANENDYVIKEERKLLFLYEYKKTWKELAFSFIFVKRVKNLENQSYM